MGWLADVLMSMVACVLAPSRSTVERPLARLIEAERRARGE